MNISDFISQNEIRIIMVLSGLCIFLFFLSLISFLKSAKLKRRIDNFMRTENADNIENMLSEYKAVAENVDKHFEELKEDISSLKNQITPCIQKTAVVRFNPFEDVGGDLSFAAAFLDKNDDGVVISSIYSRECSYSYAKEIQKGDSTKYKLSQEEKQAIENAKKIKP